MAGSLGPPDVRALFQQRVAGDDALLRLANLRFRQGGMPAEVYADNPDHLEHLLGFVPEHRTLPVVHLNRSANLLDVSGRSLVEAFASQFAGRVAGLADVLRTAVRACPPGSASFTLEIHQVEGRLPLADATDLFAHWRDLTNAERTNYWLTVLADNHLLAG